MVSADIDAISLSIEFAQQAQTVVVRPHIEAPPHFSNLSYRLDVTQRGGGNQMQLSQQGRVDAKSGQNSIKLNLQPGAQCQATLQVLADGEVIKTISASRP